MQKKPNPFDLHTVTPYLIVADVPKLIGFLEAVFDGKIRGALQYRNNGSVQHAEIVLGDSVVMMGESTEGIPAMAGGFYVYVADCDTIYKKALLEGGISISEPKDYPHGDRFAGVKDFAGNIWWITTHIGKR